jgi:hypothetical protein
VSVFLAVVFVVGPTDCRTVLADDHVVSQKDLHAAIMEARQNREKNIEGIRTFLASAPVKKILGQSNIGLIKVDQAIPLLTDQELVQLAEQTKNIERDIVGAGVSKKVGYTLLIVGVVLAIIIFITTIRDA